MGGYRALRYRHDLQILRALAISLVVLEHSGCRFFSGGFIGVDVFFVLSGYLITGLLIQEYINSNTISIHKFLLRRLKRLLPTLLLVVFSCTIIAFFILSEHQFTIQTGSKSFAITYLSNFYFAFNKINYFIESQSKDIFMHTWSLGIEEQFYLIWPLIILAIASFSKIDYQKRLHINLLIAIFLFFCVFSFCLSLHWSFEENFWAFFLMPSRAWQFSIGAICFTLIHWNHTIAQFFKKVFFFILGLFLIILSGVFLNSKMVYPGFWVLLPSIGSALVILSNTDITQEKALKIIPIKPFIILGNISYSLYLWHWPILILLPTALLYLNIQTNAALNSISIAISIIISIATHKYIETPFWKGRLSKTSNMKILFFFIVCIYLSLYIFSKVDQIASSHYTVPFSENILSARSDLPEIYKMGCDSWYHNASLMPCIFGKRTSINTVVIFGDSIGVQWFSLWKDLFSHPNWKIVVITKSACPIVEEPIFYERIGKIYKVCEEWRKDAIQYIENIKPKYLIFGSSSNYQFTESQWRNGSQKILDKLAIFSEKILVTAGTPRLSFNSLSCLEGKTLTDYTLHQKLSICEKALTANMFKNVNYQLQKITMEYENVFLLNMNDNICPNAQCKIMDDKGIFIFRDKSHLTDTFVRSQAFTVKDILEKRDWHLPKIN